MERALDCFRKRARDGQTHLPKEQLVCIMSALGAEQAHTQILLQDAGLNGESVDIERFLQYLSVTPPAKDSVPQVMQPTRDQPKGFSRSKRSVELLSQLNDIQWLLEQEEADIIEVVRALKKEHRDEASKSYHARGDASKSHLSLADVRPCEVVASAADVKKWAMSTDVIALLATRQAWVWAMRCPMQLANPQIDEHLKAMRESLQGVHGLLALFQWRGSVVQFDEEPESSEKVSKAFVVVTRDVEAKRIAKVRSILADGSDRSAPLEDLEVHEHPMKFNKDAQRHYCDICRTPIGFRGCWSCKPCGFDYCLDCASGASKRIAVGTEVLARWRGGPWHVGTIAHDHGDSTFNIEFETGIVEHRIPRPQIQLRARTNLLEARTAFDEPDEWLKGSEWLQHSDESSSFLSAVLQVDSGAGSAGACCESGNLGVKVRPVMVAYGGCAPGLRVALPVHGVPMAQRGTVVGLCNDGSYAVRVDNDFLQADQPILRPIDPRPSNVYLAKSYCYDPDVRLAVLHQNELVGATVEAWMGPRSGNQHRLKLDASQGYVDTVLMDLNQVNHSVLQFNSVEEYESARSAFCQYVLDNYTLVEDAITGNKLHIGEQTLFITADTGEAASGCWKFEKQDFYELRQRVRVNEDKIGIVHQVNPYDGAPNVMYDDGTLSGFVQLAKVEKAEAVAGVQRKKWSAINDMLDLVRLLLEPSSTRPQGAFEAQPLLMRAGPGTGKTWSLQQVYYHLALNLGGASLKVDGSTCKFIPGVDMKAVKSGIRLVPFLIPVQKLARLLRIRQQRESKEEKSLLLQYIDMEFVGDEPEKVKFRKFLYQAIEMRALILLIDGVDEAAGMKHTIEQFVLKDLVPAGLRTVVTSRPEGVNINLYTNDFVIMNLKQLTTEQQNKAIDQQLSKDTYFYHLNAFQEIRKRHNYIYTHEAFEPLKDREMVETRAQINLLEDSSGKRNGSLRQLGLDGNFVSELEDPEKPNSHYLQNLDLQYEDIMVWKRLDDALVTFSVAGKAEEAEMRDALGFSEDMERHERILVVLGCFVLKCRRGGEAQIDAKTLWRRIVARTDQIYCVAEKLRDTYKLAVFELLNKVGLDQNNLQLGPLKDPIRIYEKAMDDYSKGSYDLGDGVLPEAWVGDVVRSRIIAEDGSKIIQFQDMLSQPEGQQLSIGDSTAEVRIRLLRSKNKYAKPDPACFRNFLNNVELKQGPLSLICEMQVHHKLIYNWNEESHAHDHYNFFRSLLKNQYDKTLKKDIKELDDMDHEIEIRMKVFEEICKVPVLLSMLIVCLQAKQIDHNVNVIPNSIYQLYCVAMDSVFRRSVKEFCKGTEECYRKVSRMLETIAVANTFAGKRIFSTEDVHTALAKDFPNELNMWDHFYSMGSIPLVKVLAEADVGDSGAEFQFKHLSFQEALCLNSHIEGRNLEKLWGTDIQAIGNLNLAQLRNPIIIGGDKLGAELAKFRREWNLGTSIDNLTSYGWESLRRLLMGGSATQLRSLSLSGQTAVEGSIDMFAQLKNLEELRLDSTSIGGNLSAIRTNFKLKLFDASFSRISGSVSSAAGLECLEELGLGYLQLTGTVQEFANLVNLRRLDISGTRVTGTLAQLGTLTRLQVLDVENSELDGTLDGIQSFGDSLTILDIRETSIEGEISLDVLRCLSNTRQRSDSSVLLSRRNFSINSNLSNIGDVRVMDLSYMNICGDISLFKNMELLQKLFLTHTKLKGELGALSSCTAVEVLWLSGSKQISGALTDLKELSQLRDLRLESCSQIRGLDGDTAKALFPKLEIARLFGTSIVDTGDFPEGAFKPSPASERASGESKFSSSYWAAKLFGHTLLTKDKDMNIVSKRTRDYIKSARVVLVYFGGSWCPYCPPFSHALAESLTQYLKEQNMCAWEPADAVVVQISRDRDQDAFDQYYASFPWAAVPYENTSLREMLNRKFDVQGIPAMRVLDGMSGSLVPTEADDDYREACGMCNGPAPLGPLIQKWEGML